MKSLLQFAACLSIALVSSQRLCAESLPPAPVAIEIPHVLIAPRLNDYLEGRERLQELKVEGFRQRDPHDGQPATSSSKVFLSYDDANLYAVFVCASPAGRPRAHLSRRDDLTGDETVSLMLDTHHDGRHAYEFIANPLGVQMDGLITEGQDEDFSFDTLWRSEGRLTSDGFVVRMEIPFKSLRFKSSDRGTWGIALARYIPTTNESSTWPLLSRRSEGYVPQFAALRALPEIHTGRNLEISPHLFVSEQKFLDQSGAFPSFQNKTDFTGGMDAKWVLRDGVTLDLTARPDFSQVESDDPQVTINQRYEVYFPEKRPFFTESASFFQTPETLFFSRRIVEPQFGARLTGKVSGFTLGLLSIDDRAPAGDTTSQVRAHMGVARLQRDLGHESTMGMFFSQYANGALGERTLSIDTRLKPSPNWVATAQAVRTLHHDLQLPRDSGRSYLAEVEHIGRHFNFDTSYLDRSPLYQSSLAFVPRVDLKELISNSAYRWHPASGAILGFGPALDTSIARNHAGRLTDWQVNTPFTVNLRRSTSLTAGHEEAFERYQQLPFRQHANYATLSTELLNWASVEMSYTRGTGINYFPGPGLTPSLGRANDASLSIVLRPSSRLRLTETYLFDQLHEMTRSPGSLSVYNNHVFSTRFSMQFTRALSVREIVDFNSVIANSSLVDSDRSRIVRTDTLLTYMLNAGTAIYAGYSDRFENLSLRGNLVDVTSGPSLQTGRQAFAKITYTFRP